ncbi:unnamed protein product [Eretmochelys imbricata]
MTNAYSLDGVLVFGLLFVCTCAYFRKVPRLKAWLLSEKRGVWGVFYKGCSDWHQTSCSSGYILHCDGFLCSVHQMNLKASVHKSVWEKLLKTRTYLRRRERSIFNLFKGMDRAQFGDAKRKCPHYQASSKPRETPSGLHNGSKFSVLSVK